jgi:hypothetical protein
MNIDDVKTEVDDVKPAAGDDNASDRTRSQSPAYEDISDTEMALNRSFSKREHAAGVETKPPPPNAFTPIIFTPEYRECAFFACTYTRKHRSRGGRTIECFPEYRTAATGVGASVHT